MTSDPPTTRLIAAIVTKLRERRESLGLSKKKLAALTGVIRTAIILMEKHERQPSLELVLRIARGLEVSLSEVMAEAEKQANERARSDS